MAESPRRGGRPPGSDGSLREAILDAARELFAANGYRGTTMRAVAAAAGVDVALVAHYFKNKDGLFTATLQTPEDGLRKLQEALGAPLAQRGKALATAYLDLWEAPATGEQLRVVARSALGNETFGEQIENQLSGLLGITRAPNEHQPGPRTSTGLALAQLLGIAVARHLVRVPLVAALPFDELVELVAPGIQTLLELEHARTELTPQAGAWLNQRRWQ
ncbi:MAG: TetR family transcriptional regulator [Brooklawnia sp.]|jgi:AcrR family transcriptional regulator